MAADLNGLAQILEASLDPSQNKQGPYDLPSDLLASTNLRIAELAILQGEKKANFSISLLQIVAADSYSDTARLASALYFKNFIKRSWIVS